MISHTITLPPIMLNIENGRKLMQSTVHVLNLSGNTIKSFQFNVKRGLPILHCNTHAQNFNILRWSAFTNFEMFILSFNYCSILHVIIQC